jgi:hypothetical protein
MKPAEKVVDAVVKSPAVKATTVEVETPYVCVVNGKTELVAPTQTLPIEKQPVARLIPLLNVDVADPVVLRAAALIPAEKVEVAAPDTVRIPVERDVDVAAVVVERVIKSKICAPVKVLAV